MKIKVNDKNITLNKNIKIGDIRANKSSKQNQHPSVIVGGPHTIWEVVNLTTNPTTKGKKNIHIFEKQYCDPYKNYVLSDNLEYIYLTDSLLEHYDEIINKTKDLDFSKMVKQNKFLYK